jgi:hypothetical protein
MSKNLDRGQVSKTFGKGSNEILAFFPLYHLNNTKYTISFIKFEAVYELISWNTSHEYSRV